MSARIIAHVDMDAFFASVEQRYQPALRGTPIVVCGNPTQRTAVAACSYEAKAYGIANGMSIAQARALCPQVRLIPGDPQKYVDIAQRIFAALADFTPSVEVFSIDEAFLDLGATFRWFGETPLAAAARIKRRIRDVCGLSCSVGIGPNKLIAKLASTLRKPDGLVEVREEDVPPLLARLPVEKLCGVGARLRAALNELGIMTCADLGRAPEALLIRKFGVIGGLLRRMGQGLDEQPVAPCGFEAPAKSMGHAYTLPRDTAELPVIRGTLLRLAEQVARRLRADGARGRTVNLTIRYADFSTCIRHRTLGESTDTGLAIARAALALFERHCEPLAQRVRLIGVGVSQLSRRERQLSLLEDEQRLERLDRCLDQLHDRFGECRVIRASAMTPLVAKSHGFLLKAGQGRRILT